MDKVPRGPTYEEYSDSSGTPSKSDDNQGGTSTATVSTVLRKQRALSICRKTVFNTDQSVRESPFQDIIQGLTHVHMANASGKPPEISFVMTTRHPFRARLMIEDLVQDARYWEDQERLCRQDQNSVRVSVHVPRTNSDLVWTTIQDIASQDYPGHSLDFIVYGLRLRFPEHQPFRAQTPINMAILFCPEMHLFAQDDFSPLSQVIECLIHFFAHVDEAGAGSRKLRLIDMPSFIIPSEELPKDKAEARNLVAARLTHDMERMSFGDQSRPAAKDIMENLELVDSPEDKEIRWLTRDASDWFVDT